MGKKSTATTSYSETGNTPVWFGTCPSAGIILSMVPSIGFLFSPKLCPTLGDPRGLQPARLLCPSDFPGKDTGMVCHFPLQGIFPTQRFNPCLRSWPTDSLPLSHRGSPQGRHPSKGDPTPIQLTLEVLTLIKLSFKMVRASSSCGSLESGLT